MSSTKRLMIYIVPVTVLSFSLNIPKFMEVTITQTNGTNLVDPSETRRDPTFIFWYTLSLIWHPTLTTGILPFIALVYMNLQIFVGIRKTRKVRFNFFRNLINASNYFRYSRGIRTSSGRENQTSPSLLSL